MTNRANQLIHSFSASMDVTKYIPSRIHTSSHGLVYVISIIVRISNIGDASFFCAVKIQAVDNDHVFAENV